MIGRFHRGFRAGVAGLLVMGGALTVSVAVATQPASATTAATLYVATTGNDTGNDCTVMSSPCATIQNAINSAEGGSYNGDDVTIDVAAGTYDENDTVAASSLNSLTILGAGSSTSAVNGGASSNVFIVDNGSVGIDALTLTNGSNSDNAQGGGGVDNFGTLTLSNDVLSGDDAINGGGLLNWGDVSLSNDTFTNDNGSFGGGGVYNNGSVTLDDDTFTNDTAGDFGGGIANYSTITTLTDDTLSHDSAGADGGGVAILGGSTPNSFTGDTFSYDGTDQDSLGGGGIYNQSQTALGLNDDTFSNDSSDFGGGVANYGSGQMSLTDDTLANDSASDAGGGVANFGSANLTDDTLSDDTAPPGQGAGISAQYESEYASGGTTTTDSILDSAGCDVAITDGGYNVESDNSCGFGPTSLVDSSAINLAATLAPNGSSGPETLAINPDSSAYEEVPQSACTVPTDERGDSRPGVSGQNCDAGAYEYQSPDCAHITITTTFIPDGTVGQPYSTQLTACGGTPPYTWNKYGPAGDGALPRRLALSRSGVISGTPKKAGSYTITVKCLDESHSHKTQATEQLTLIINP
jgi:hypothetical protein